MWVVIFYVSMDIRFGDFMVNVSVIVVFGGSIVMNFVLEVLLKFVVGMGVVWVVVEFVDVKESGEEFLIVVGVLLVM